MSTYDAWLQTAPEPTDDALYNEAATERAISIFSSRCPVLIGNYLEHFGCSASDGAEWLFNHSCMDVDIDLYSLQLYISGERPPVPGAVYMPGVREAEAYLYEFAMDLATVCVAKLQREAAEYAENFEPN